MTRFELPKIKKGEFMMQKLMNMVEEITGGKSYKAHKYGLDHAERPEIDYGVAIISLYKIVNFIARRSKLLVAQRLCQ
jgi:hypothetical protein